ncbi:Fibroblast growth factor 5, partial [Dryobates pubescens]
PSSSSSSSAALAAAGPSRFPRSRPGRRRGRLYCRVGIGFHLQLPPDGRVDGAHDASPLSVLEIFAVSQGIVGIRGVFSNKFLAMSKKGKLHANSFSQMSPGERHVWRRQPRGRGCSPGASAHGESTGLQAGFWAGAATNPRGEICCRGLSPRPRPQHVSTHFLPRFRQPQPPELAFTVTLPEKKPPPKPKVVPSPPRKNPVPVKYRLKFRFG